MDYTLVITTPDKGRTTTGCATMTDVQNHIVDFIRHNKEQNFLIELILNP
jgi:hypothetical protein